LWHDFGVGTKGDSAPVAASGGATGTGALTTGATTASGSGTLTHTGTGSLTSGVTTLSGEGTLTHTGTGALTTSAVTIAGEGEIVGAVSGTGALTTGVTTLSGSGVISHIGTGSLTVGNVTASGTGTAGSGIGVPANLEGTPTSTTIVWTWDAVSGATGYEIEYGPDGGGYTVTDVGANLTYTQTSLSAATLYEARVRAYVDTVSDRIILESGDGYLLESGDSLLQEAA
jgi:filamentous hemagglutinin